MSKNSTSCLNRLPPLTPPRRDPQASERMARALDEWVAVQCLAESLAGTSPRYLRL